MTQIESELATKTSPKLIMGNPAPSLEVNILAGNSFGSLRSNRWSLAEQNPVQYTMVVFYRGVHCPICQQYVTELEEKLEAFQKLGVEAIAISGDTQEKAQQFHDQSNLQNLTIGYGLTPDDMRRWGLYLSKGHFESEPTVFSEPALFLVKPDGQLYFADIGTHPFARPNLELLLQGLAYVIANNYPFRGTEWN